MKINATNSWMFVTLLSTAGMCVPGAVRAEDSNLNRANEGVGKATLMIQGLQPVQQSQPPQNAPYVNNPFGRAGTLSLIGDRSGTNVPSAIRKAAEAVRDAKSEEAKSDAQKKLAELLSKSYDDDMVQREHELKQIEERLTKLRGLLDRRRTKKQEIIELQTKVALNEAEGLGFYDFERPAKASPFYYSQPPVDAAAGTAYSGSSSGEIPSPAAPPSPPAPRAPRAVPR